MSRRGASEKNDRELLYSPIGVERLKEMCGTEAGKLWWKRVAGRFLTGRFVVSLWQSRGCLQGSGE